MRIALLTAVALIGCTDQGPETFRTVTSEQEGTLLSAFVASDGTAYLAGGVLRGGTALLLRWDGRTLTPIPTGDAHAFWWIHGVADHDMWLAGESGEVHRFDGTTVTRVDAGAPADATLFGIWGATSDDVWTVGGSFLTGGPHRVIRHLVGGTWTDIASPDTVDPEITYFKVWGPSATDVWIVGDRGVVLRDDGTTLVRVDAPPSERYLTVHGCDASNVFVVGGGGSGAGAHFDGAAWTPLSLTGVPALNGVFCGGHETFVGGFCGYAARVENDTPRVFPLPHEVAELAIHGVAIGPRRVVAVGGDLTAVPPAPQRGFAVEIPR